ncbi:MAG: tetratricopeptide repeat protein, partial [Candidatus Omnitrophica bacterium]|nr:tetratricopeptide repeat protein [Candidatus Omnitrophota bacterium]
MTRRHFFILVFAGLLIFETCGCASAPKVRKRALRSPSQEIFKIAERKKAPSSLSPKAYAHYSMGMIYDNEGSTDQAVEEYCKAIEFDPYAAQAYYRLGSEYLKLGKVDEAVEILKKAVELDEKNARARF